MLVNDQTAAQINSQALSAFLKKLARALSLRGKDWNVCLVDDRKMKKLNAHYRGRNKTTDVLAFAWQTNDDELRLEGPSQRELANFLGDILISVETARRNARRAGHSVEREIEWLILHGLLHLLGYDHETDHGEMASLESRLRQQLAGRRSRSFAGKKN